MESRQRHQSHARSAESTFGAGRSSDMKVIVRRAGSGIAAASSLLVAAGGAAGCIAEDADPGGQEETAEASDAITGGSARLSAGGWPGDVSLTVTGSTT